MSEMTVGQLARRTGTSPDTVRYYERIGLLPPPARSASGYRLFRDADVERVSFIRRAQRFGLRLEEVGELLEMRERGLCPCGHTRDLLVAKLGEIDEQLRSLGRLRDDIEALLETGATTPAAGERCAVRLYQLSPRERSRQ